MKKFLMILIASLALSGSIFAQHTTHWPEFDLFAYENNDYIVSFIQVNGNFIESTDNWQDYEVAAVVNNAIRGTAFLSDYTLEFGDPHPVIEMSVYYDNTGESVSFILYDHSTGTDYTDCTTNIAITTGEDHTEEYDDPDTSVVLSFTGSAPVTPSEYTWNVPETGWDVPASGANVTIPDNSIVTIPTGVTANAGTIDLPSTSTIIIEDGGALYHSNAIPVTLELNTEGYVSTTKGMFDKYRLIAIPINPTIAVPSEMTDNAGCNYDLYFFDQSQAGEEWRNYKQGTFNEFEYGKGYLYAIQNTPTIPVSFLGATFPTNQDIAVDLLFDAGKPCEGWNLIGNPFTCKAYINKPFYRLNSDGSALEAATNNAINPLEGIFVGVDAAETCTFTTTSSKANPSLNIVVSQANNKVDNAIISFSNGSNLGKFQLNPSQTKVYMPVEGRDYAVVSADNQGEMPVSFEAESNGTYTLNFASEDTEFSYLHLIDNMTGNDVDLLQTPSYSFNALTTDYASRFKLVFATGNASDDSFAFVSDGNIILTGDSNATVQVIDALGRVIVSENGANTISTMGMASGVYVLRLINGNDTKTQKIVVK